MTDEEMSNNITAFAQIAHKLDVAYAAAVYGENKPGWHQLPAEDRKHISDRVVYYLTDPNAVVSSLHEKWAYSKLSSGWSYGKEFNEEKKQHPLLISYSELPLTRRVADTLFMQTVQTLSRLL